MKKQFRVRSRFFRCLHAAVAIFSCAVLLMAQSGGITTKDPKAKAAVDTALKALGGTDKIGGIKSIVIKGTETSATGWSGVPGGEMKKTNSATYAFEIRVLLPDSFIKINRIPDRIIYSGISRGALLTLIPSRRTPVGISAEIRHPHTPENESEVRNQAALYNTRIDEWSRLLIGMVAKIGPVPMTLSSGSKPDRLTLAKTDGDVCEIEFDSKTGYPSVVRYKEVSALPNLPSSGTPVILGPRIVDQEIRFRDRFSVNGIMFPRIISMNGDMLDTEMKIEEVQINPNLSLKDFEIPKKQQDVNK